MTSNGNETTHPVTKVTSVEQQQPILAPAVVEKTAPVSLPPQLPIAQRCEEISEQDFDVLFQMAEKKLQGRNGSSPSLPSSSSSVES